MNCRTVQVSFSAHLDGLLSEEERHGLISHLDRCHACESQFAQMVRVRAALRRLPANVPPAQLSTSLQVMASKERVRRQYAGVSASDRFRLWVDNLMRPVALPFAGGFLSAVLLFGMLLPTFTLRRGGGGTDIPVALFTDPVVKGQVQFPVFDDNGMSSDIDVDVTVDDQGRMVDYSLPKGSMIENNPALRRALENKLLLFTEFAPATSFGTPTYGKVRVSFRRQSIEIKS